VSFDFFPCPLWCPLLERSMETQPHFESLRPLEVVGYTGRAYNRTTHLDERKK